MMLYDSSGTLILDQDFVTPSFTLSNGGWYFLACLIRPNDKTAQYILGDRRTSGDGLGYRKSFSLHGDAQRLPARRT
jgi:hypothetical protein